MVAWIAQGTFYRGWYGCVDHCGVTTGTVAGGVTGDVYLVNTRDEARRFLPV